MTDGGDDRGNKVTDGKSGGFVGQDLPVAKPAQSAQPSTDKGSAPMSTPTASLCFGSFQAMAAPSHLWGDRVEMEEEDDNMATNLMVEQQYKEPLESSLQMTGHRRQFSPGEVEAVHIGQEAQGTNPSPLFFSLPTSSLRPKERGEDDLIRLLHHLWGRWLARQVGQIRHPIHLIFITTTDWCVTTGGVPGWCGGPSV